MNIEKKMNSMKTLFVNLKRKTKLSEESKHDEDSIELLESRKSKSKKRIDFFLFVSKQKLKSFYLLIRRIKLSIVFRFLFLFPLLIYLILMIFPSMKNIQSFIPKEIHEIKNFLLVVAHPDDECLFFSPTILQLIQHGKKAHLLVLSNGNNEGLGSIREKELNSSCQQLLIDLDRCFLLNSIDFQDNPKRWWPKENISSIIDIYIQRLNIDLLITFDRYGISGHLNHRSIAFAVEYYYLKQNIRLKPRIYQLKSLPFLFEFSSIWNLFPTLITFLPRLLRNFFSKLIPFLIAPPDDQNLLFISSPFSYYRGLKAFHSHRTQMLWYRHFYTTFSRFMWINELKKFSIN